VAVGGPALLRDTGVEVPDVLDDQAAKWSARGAAVLYVLEADKVIGALALADEVRPESREAIDQLHKRGIRVVMITGDARAVAEAVATDLGVDEVFAEVLPEDKDSKVAELQAAASASPCRRRSLTTPSPGPSRRRPGHRRRHRRRIESAGVVPARYERSQRYQADAASYRKMVQNLAWATGYNLIAVPLAAGVLAGVGVVLSPAVGAILMSASTLVVAANAQLLRRIDLRPEAAS
jgi:Cu2+-exporting ATPase